MSENFDQILEQTIGVVGQLSDVRIQWLLEKYRSIFEENLSEKGDRLTPQDVFKVVLQQIPEYFEKGYTKQLNKLHDDYHPSITLGELAFTALEDLAKNNIIKYSVSEFLRNKIDELDKQQEWLEKQHEEDPHQVKTYENLPKHIENFSKSMKDKLKKYIETITINKNKINLKDYSAAIKENKIDNPEVINIQEKPISKEVYRKYEDLLTEYLEEKNQRNTNYFLVLKDQILKDLEYIKNASAYTYDYNAN